MPLRTLPPLQRGVPIVDNTGKPTGAFVRYWNVDFIGALQQNLNDLAAVQAEQAAQQAELTDQQEQLTAQVAQIQAILGIVNASNTAIQAASEAANNAQATADEALAGGTVSGFATDPAIDVPEGGGWIPGPQVDLVGVVAGNLTLAGTGPLQDGDVAITNPEVAPGGITFTGDFRVMEIILAVETEVFAGTMSAFQSFSSTNASISNDSAAAVAAFSLARASTGDVSYRLDFLAQSGSATSLKGYLFARRAA